MVFATTHAAALFALILALVCFSVWPNLYKKARWRFELFALDFALGALLLAFVAAYTFGTLGPEMSFTDRMLVAGRTAWLWIFATGIVLAFGNMLVLVSISLLGLAAALPISFGLAIVLFTAIHYRFVQTSQALAGMVLLVVGILCALAGSRRMKRTVKRGWVKGVCLAISAGVPLALAEWMLSGVSDPEFGPGPYASVLMLALGFVIATPAYNFFFMHIKIVGNPIGFAHYKIATRKMHVPGLLSGMIWATGMLALLVAFSATGDAELGTHVRFILPLFSIAFCALSGLFGWGEYAAGGRRVLLVTALCFIAGVLVTGFALTN
ncbi:MAG TPA: hypothetical protein VH477_16870 [Bryobacteraceae bacterium]